jgi:ribosome-associated translation inhibitor RaiA
MGKAMQTPTEVAFHHCETSEAICAEVAKQTQRLEKFSSRITSRHVAVTRSAARHRQGDLFQVDVRIAMPGQKTSSSIKRMATRPNTNMPKKPVRARKTSAGRCG